MIHFVRCLFGHEGRRIKVNNDIRFCLSRKNQIPFHCFTYGEDNHKQLIDLGVDSILVCKESLMFPDAKWTHKLWTWVLAAEKYGKFVYLDWDVELTAPLPRDYAPKAFAKPLQATLRQYFNRKCLWRKLHQRKTPCASYVQFGDPTVAKKIWDLWIKMGKPRKEEAVLARYTEGKNGLNLDDYYKDFEPEYFSLRHESVFKNKPKPLFVHWSTQSVRNAIKKLDIKKK